MTLPNQKLNQKDILFVQEEYGFRHWVGVLPKGMTIESVIEWWKALPSVMGMFFNPSGGFPMELFEVKDVADDDAEVAIMQWVDSEGQTHILDRKNVVLFAHTHEDDDSYLKIPQGEYIYHAGRVSEWYDDDDIEEEYAPPPTPEEMEDIKTNHPYVYKALMKDMDNGNDSSDTK